MWTVHTDTVPLVLHNCGYSGRMGWETAIKYIEIICGGGWHTQADDSDAFLSRI